jgi:hypothetical protein
LLTDTGKHFTNADMRTVLDSLEGARSGLITTTKEQEGQLKTIQLEEANLANSLQALEKYEDGCSGYFSTPLPPAFPQAAQMPPMGLFTPVRPRTSSSSSNEHSASMPHTPSRALSVAPPYSNFYTHSQHPSLASMPDRAAPVLCNLTPSSENHLISPRMPTASTNHTSALRSHLHHESHPYPVFSRPIANPKPSSVLISQKDQGKQNPAQNLEYRDILKQQTAMEKKALEERQVQNFMKRKAARENNLPPPPSTQELHFMPLEFIPVKSGLPSLPKPSNKTHQNKAVAAAAAASRSSNSNLNGKASSNTSPAAHMPGALSFPSVFSPSPDHKATSEQSLPRGPPPPYSRRPAQGVNMENEPPAKRVREETPAYDEIFVACAWQELVTPALGRRGSSGNQMASAVASSSRGRNAMGIGERCTEEGTLGHSAFQVASNVVVTDSSASAIGNGNHLGGGQVHGRRSMGRRRDDGTSLFIPFVVDSDDDAEGETDLEADSGRSYTPPPPPN